jgi:hypothetical protein
VSAQQSTKESDDLAIHTILDEVHDGIDQLEEGFSTLERSRELVQSQAGLLRYLPVMGEQERSFLLDHAATVVRHIDLLDRAAEAARAEVPE